MALRTLSPDATYKTEVEALVPVEEGGTTIAKFTVWFRYIPVSEYRDYSVIGDAEVVRNVVTNWEGIEDADGNEYVFNQDHLDEIVEMSFFYNGVLNAYNRRFNPLKNY